jgi:4-amino-4-deoxy-L-arabinose transferase-like glycosyltransferase
MHGPTPQHLSSPRVRDRDLGLFALAVVLLLPAIWSEASVSGQDEYYLSFRTVLEMQARGDWLVPWVNGEVRLQKPPLLYWAMLACMELFGPNLFAARLPSVLAGAGFVVATARLARRCGAPGVLAGLLVLGAAGVAIEARRAMFDLPVACLSTWAIVFALDWQRWGRGADLLAAAVALAAAAMTKGPVALWFFVAPLLAAALVRRGRPAGPLWHVPVAVAVFATLALPWPMWVARAYPKFFEVMANQAENRAFGLGNLQRLPGLLGALLGLCVPWSLLLVGTVVATMRGRPTSTRSGRWLLAWAGLGLVPFVLMNSFERYMLALVAPLAVVSAAWLQELPLPALRRHLLVAIGLLAVPVLGFGILVAWFGVGILAAGAGIVLLVQLWRHVRRSDTPEPGLVLAGLALASTILLGAIYPALGINRLPDELPAGLANTRVATFGRPQPGMLSMRVGRSVEQFDGDERGLPERLGTFHGHLFVHEADLERVRTAAAQAQRRPTVELEFGSFYSRKAWLRFLRDDLDWATFMAAVRARSLAPLQPRFTCLHFD